MAGCLAIVQLVDRAAEEGGQGGEGERYTAQECMVWGAIVYRVLNRLSTFSRY